MRPSANLVVFAAAHAACLAAVRTGVEPADLVLCLVLYVARMFGITAGYHRYFSHRTFELGRPAAFALAWLAQSSAQKSVLGWAASDEPDDVHSPVQRGFWYSHVGWIFDRSTDRTDLSKVRDLAQFPELRWLHRWELVPAATLALACFAIGGWSGLIVGFFWSTVLTWHGTFTINSLSHVFGSRRYATSDDSRNNALLAMITLGEGWHNNHHRYPGSTRQGFVWWQLDPTWWGLRALERVGVARKLRGVPDGVLREGRYLRPLADETEQLGAPAE